MVPSVLLVTAVRGLRAPSPVPFFVVQISEPRRDRRLIIRPRRVPRCVPIPVQIVTQIFIGPRWRMIGQCQLTGFVITETAQPVRDTRRCTGMRLRGNPVHRIVLPGVTDQIARRPAIDISMRQRRQPIRLIVTIHRSQVRSDCTHVFVPADKSELPQRIVSQVNSFVLHIMKTRPTSLPRLRHPKIPMQIIERVSIQKIYWTIESSDNRPSFRASEIQLGNAISSKFLFKIDRFNHR